MMDKQQQLDVLPRHPGVYLFKDGAGNILYVGKAKSLRLRVRSYFRPTADLDPAKQQMIPRIADIQTITCDNETEALILEANLIRQHQPPYNVVLRDDKFYLFIKITTGENYPRVFPVRRIKKDQARYFGPYSSAASVRSTLKLLRRIFPYRGEKDSSREKVFPHPLFSQDTNNVSESASNETTYQQNIDNIIRFLRGHRQDITTTLRAGMKIAARAKQFERAAIFRDQLRAIERLEGAQKVFLPRKESFDTISVAHLPQSNLSAANIFQIRDGKLLGQHTFLLRHRDGAPTADVVRQFLLQYYSVAQDIPPVILVPTELDDAASLSTWMNTNTPPRISAPQRGKKRQLITMGEHNAKQLLDTETADFEAAGRAKDATRELAKVLGIKKEEEDDALARIETYDISNIQGAQATGSMVVFTNGQPDKSQYRKFKITREDGPNDYAMMQEILERRFSGKHEDWQVPDLILIDGGKGQLSAAKKTLDQKKVVVPVASLAKREEELFTPGVSQSIRLPYDSPALFLIQRMRDEAHRFTITYHRLLRSKKQRHSLLDEVPGIGPKTKKRLLNHFGSLKAIRAATNQELTKIISTKQAQTLRDYL